MDDNERDLWASQVRINVANIQRMNWMQTGITALFFLVGCLSVLVGILFWR